MACCAVSAYVIYLILRTHDRFRSTLAAPLPQPKKGYGEAVVNDIVPCAKKTESPATAIFHVTGMSCGACSAAITHALEQRPGVVRANVLLPASQARVAYFANAVNPAELGAVIDGLGYEWHQRAEQEPWVTAFRRRSQEQLLEMAATRKRLVTATWLTAIVLLPALLPRQAQVPFFTIVQCCICAFLVLVAGSAMHMQAWTAAKIFRIDMYTLSSVALLLSFLRSTVWAYMGLDASFHHIATLTTVLTGASLIKQTASHRPWAPFTSIADRMPTEVDVLQQANVETARDEAAFTRIPTKLLRIGDVLAVSEGVPVPADGVAKSMVHVVDTFATGELHPRRKKPGDLVYAGSVVQHGLLHMQVQHVASDTLLEQLLASVAEADNANSSQDDLLERILRSYCSGVFVIAVFVGLCQYMWLGASSTEALDKSIAILLSTCPCALTLMVPSCVALLTGRAHPSHVLPPALTSLLGHAFSQGQILLSGAKHVARAASSAKVVLFDKTGTLTQPDITVCGMSIESSAPGVCQSEIFLWQVIAALEVQSIHVVGQALRRHAEKQIGTSRRGSHRTEPPRASGVQTLDSLGVVGFVSWDRSKYLVAVGSEKLMEQLGVRMGPCHSTSAFGSSVRKQVFLAVDNSLVATLGLNESLRADAKQTVRDLQAEGYLIGLVCHTDQTKVTTET